MQLGAKLDAIHEYCVDHDDDELPGKGIRNRIQTQLELWSVATASDNDPNLLPRTVLLV